MDNQTKLYNVVAKVFNVDSTSINSKSSPDNVKGWDSIGMVNLITELEQVFNVSFEILEIVEMHNISIIQSILAEKKIKFND
jgi:acyl carrier protein